MPCRNDCFPLGGIFLFKLFESDAMDSNFDVVDQVQGEQFNPSGNDASGRAMSWIGYGFDQFKASPGVWIGMILIYFVISFVLGLIPFLGGIVSNILAPVFIGGFMLAGQAHKEGRSVEINHLFEGFKDKFGSLALVGLFYFIGAIVMMIILGIIAALFLGGMFAAGGLSGGNITASLMSMGFGLILVFILLIFVISIPLAMSIWLAPALVVFHNVAPFDALIMSFKGTLKNFGTFLLYGLLCFLFAIVATIPFGLGWLVLAPTLIGATYCAYRDIFVK